MLPALILATFCVGPQPPTGSGDAPSPATDPEGAAAESATEVPKALKSLAPLIGKWNGVGQVRRGSSRGAWRETAEWRYDFSGDRPAVVYAVTDGPHVAEARLFVDENDILSAAVTPPGGQPRTATVEPSAAGENRWTIVSLEAGLRLTVRRLNEKRSLVLVEALSDGRPRRLGEVGYTRDGERLARSGPGGPECVVTGGLGTIRVSHKGQTYWVCCSGCKAAFDADPEAILAARKARADGRSQSP